jgi:hypothetical protein
VKNFRHAEIVGAFQETMGWVLVPPTGVRPQNLIPVLSNHINLSNLLQFLPWIAIHTKASHVPHFLLKQCWIFRLLCVPTSTPLALMDSNLAQPTP